MGSLTVRLASTKSTNPIFALPKKKKNAFYKSWKIRNWDKTKPYERDSPFLDDDNPQFIIFQLIIKQQGFLDPGLWGEPAPTPSQCCVHRLLRPSWCRLQWCGHRWWWEGAKGRACTWPTRNPWWSGALRRWYVFLRFDGIQWDLMGLNGIEWKLMELLHPLVIWQFANLRAANHHAQ